ncbi:glutamate-rich protein 6 isoform X3 [Pristis pectinata]|uniref:glutamate-rich protein 6 isoform X3 n=1 Tax=Pristis pectinata TaxID=685728 RepID=UPI00223DCB6A|nr:glutamate-rich protein 6 isoform X3 [Pristis pectinata]
MSGGKDDPESQAQLDRAGSSHYLSILSSFTPEESLTDCDPGNENEYNSSTSEISLCLLDSSAESFATPERPPTSVLTQTDSSWLLSRRLRETAQGEHLDTHEERGGQESASDGTEASEKESDSILEGDLSDSTSKESLEDLIVHTEFIDQLKPGRFGSCLYTLPSIGLPTILAYKYESREKPIDYKALSPKLFCCKQYQELSEFLMEEEELLHLKSQSEVIDISPHLPHSSFVERQQAKEKSALRLHKRTMEKYLKKAKETEHKLSSGSKRHTTITFQLSTSLDVEKLKKPREEEDEWDNIFTEVVDDTFSWHKDLPLSFLVKNYKNGNKFLTTFADGTAQIFYPSGNLAILIFTDKERKITCIVQEDRAADPAIRAVFTSFGRCTCYHPNGVVWVNTNAFGGHYADEQGTRLRRWFWRDPSSPLTFTPFKPLFISLNENIGVRIIEQQRIFLTFLAMGKQAKFNLGSMLKFKTPTMQSITNSWMTEADLLLQTSWLKVQTIINKLCVALNFPSNDPEKIALPLYLVTRQQKLSQLYASIKMEESINMENVA